MKPDNTLQLIAVCGVFALMTFALGVVAFVTIPEKQLELFAALASGVIGSALGGIVGFLFGSSLGSRAKDAALITASQPDPQS